MRRGGEMRKIEMEGGICMLEWWVGGGRVAAAEAGGGAGERQEATGHDHHYKNMPWALSVSRVVKV